jgi:hypothetical protein
VKPLLSRNCIRVHLYVLASLFRGLTSKSFRMAISLQVARLAAEIEASNRILEMAQRT